MSEPVRIPRRSMLTHKQETRMAIATVSVEWIKSIGIDLERKIQRLRQQIEGAKP